MPRPWYSWLLVAIAALTFVGVLFRPLGSLGFAGPGARAPLGGKVVTWVDPGGPLGKAGLQAGDRLLELDGVAPGGAAGELAWTGTPGWANLRVERDGRQLTLAVRPEPTEGALALAWVLLKVLNLGLVALALALFWQQPRDGRAVLLGLLLLSAPVLVLPPSNRLWALCLAAHFFRVFPTAGPGPRWPRLVGLYGVFALVAVVTAGLADDGRGREALAVYHLGALGFALYGFSRAALRWREADEAGRPLAGTLTVAAGAILAAVLLGLSERPEAPSPQASLLPAALFSGAVAHLVFRLRALEVRVIARRTLQYLLARWTLGTLFLIPGFILVFHLGELAGREEQIRPAGVLGYLLWMLAAALLLAKRRQVLQNLDRRFFRDLAAVRQALVGLARQLGSEGDGAQVVRRLTAGVREILQPVTARFEAEEPPGDVPPGGLAVPVRCGEHSYGVLVLGPKEDGSPYSAEERDLLAAAAAQAGTALENARLRGVLLERQREELAARTAGMLAGQEEERRRLAADLHDQVLPDLRRIAGDCERLRERANGLEPELIRLEGEVRETMGSVRDVMEALRPSALDVLGLADALEAYFRKAGAGARPPLTVSVRRVGPEPDLEPRVSLALYRICQEAINNVARHAGGSRAGLEIRNEEAGLTLAVWDAGPGFDPEGRPGGHGLGNIRQRADLIGAEVEWRSRDEGGTWFQVRLPAARIEARA